MIIESSPKLNEAVAKAIGWKHLDDEQHEGIPPEGEYKYIPIPCFSTDLNAAFAAAEKVGLFSETFWRVLGMDELGETWGVFDEGEFGVCGMSKVAKAGEQHATPALAICAAILELEEK